MLYKCERIKSNDPDRYYLIDYIYEMVKDDNEFLRVYKAAPTEIKQATALYYGLIKFAKSLIEEKESKLKFANDYERIKLNEYLDGYRYAVKCFNDAYIKSEGENL